MWKDIKREYGIQDHEERWLRYADNALFAMDTTDIVWSGIEEFPARHHGQFGRQFKFP